MSPYHLLSAPGQAAEPEERMLTCTVMYNASVKVLNPINKDFTMFTPRSLTVDDINTPASIRGYV